MVCVGILLDSDVLFGERPVKRSRRSGTHFMLQLCSTYDTGLAQIMADLQRAFLSLPPVTRTVLAGVAAVTLPPMLALVSPYQLIFYWPAIRHKFQLWRLVTPFLYAGSGISALFNCFFLFRTANDLETGRLLSSHSNTPLIRAIQASTMEERMTWLGL